MSLKISIVTPCFNSARFIEATIRSVINQSHDNIEYIIIDGGSTDGTVDIIRKYEDRLAFWVSEPDDGMYDAVNKGFDHATGEIMAWLNSDDIYLPDALTTVSKAFEKRRDVEWLHGRDVRIDESGSVVRKNMRFWLYQQADLAAGLHGLGGRFVDQHCCFWRKNLWLTQGPVASNLRYAGDYALWVEFAKRARLVGLNFPVAAFRSHEGQLHKDGRKYLDEMWRIYNGPSVAMHFRRFVWRKLARRFTWDVRAVNFLRYAPPFEWIDPQDEFKLKKTYSVSLD